MKSWNKGFTKETHPSVKKISQTMRRKKIDNFKYWREKAKKIGVIPGSYPDFKKSKELAEYIGVVLGDGNISEFPRTERIIISCNANNPGFINYYAKLTEKIFNKRPTVSRILDKNSVRISLYQKNISKRLGIPSGNRGGRDIKMPNWIFRNKVYLIKFLRGLFEAEGSLSVHKKTYTYNFQFSNRNKSLLRITERGLRALGFNPEIRKNIAIRLRRKKEVKNFRELIKFRVY